MAKSSAIRQVVTHGKSEAKKTEERSGKSAKNARRKIISAYMSGHPLSPGVPWAELLEMPRVVILAEAGAGKTEELRLRAKILQNEGKSAFFCRMESIAEVCDFRKALLPKEEKRFDKWLKDGDVGYFFVDSVDEAKLRNFRVDSALRPLSRVLDDAQIRARVYISARVSEWDYDRDFADFRDCLGDTPRTALLLPLDSQQQELFVEELKLPGGKAMLEAARKTGDYLVNRPLDLRRTAEYWANHGQIDFPMKMMENFVPENLRERDSERAKKRPLNSDKARRGVESLAAALTLCGKSRILISSRALVRLGGMDASEVLPGWGADDISALLERPIFDPEIRGGVQFHNREMREYLVASWFRRMLDGGGLSGKAQRILSAFETSAYGESFIYPAMRPIAAWLAQMEMENEEEGFSRRMLKLEPIAMVTYGDPSVLSLKFRGNALRAVVEKIADNLETEKIYDIPLERFGDKDIANVVNELLDAFSGNSNVVKFLLRVVRQGKITECADKALNIALNESTVEDLRGPAIYAVVDASVKHSKKLAEGVANQADKWTGRDLIRAMSRLFPQSMNVGQFVQCIEKKAGTWKELADNTYLLKDIPLEGMTVEELKKFLNGILAAAKARAKSSGGWAESLTAMLAAKALMPLLESSGAPHEDEEILCAIEALEEYRGMGFPGQGNVVTKISANSRLVHALYWRAFQREGHAFRATSKMWRLSDSSELFQMFLPDIREQMDAEKRENALRVICQYWQPGVPGNADILAEIRAALDGNDAMLRKLDERLERGAESRREQEQWTKSHKERERKEQEAKKKELRESVEILRKKPAQLCDFDAEVPAYVVNNLLYLQDWMLNNNKPTGADESDSDNDACHWKSMIPDFGEEVARCARDGMMKFWRTYNPKPISEVRAGRTSWSTDTRVFLGMLGLDILHQRQPNWTAKLTADEAARAARYATHCSNKFPKWFAELISERQEAAGEVIRIEMEKDIRQFADNASPNILPAMLHNDEFLGKFFAQMALDILEANPTMGKNARYYVSHLLRFLKDDDAAERKAKFYRGRIVEKDTDDKQPFWLAEWMRMDANAALEELERHLRDIDNSDDANKFMVNFCGNFWDEAHAYNTQGLRGTGLWGNIGRLRKMLRLTLTHVRYENDIKRTGSGVFSPKIRDHAQDFRDGLFNHLVTECSGEEACRAMIEFSADTALDDHTRGVLRVYARRYAEKDAKFSAWKPAEVVHFTNDMTPPLHDPNKFFQWFLYVLNKLKSGWEGGNFSPKGQIHNEEDAQILAAHDMEIMGERKFSVTREDVVIERKERDIRIQPYGGDGVVSVEMKIADNWSFRALHDALEKQLPQYLRDPDARHGILLLVYKGWKKKWRISSRLADFDKLTDVLGNQAKELARKIKDVDDIRVIGVDLSKAEKSNPPPRSPRKKVSGAPSAKRKKKKDASEEG